jgi:hypothetical protein
MVLRSELMAALSEGEAKAVEVGMLELQLGNLREQLISSNSLLQESMPRSELLSFQTNMVVLFQEFKELVTSFRQEAKLWITLSISRIDEILSDPEFSKPAVLALTCQGRIKNKSHLGTLTPALNDNLNESNDENDKDSLSEESMEISSFVHDARKQGRFKLGSTPPPINDGLVSSVNQFDEISMSEDNFDQGSNISTGESVTAHSIL